MAGQPGRADGSWCPRVAQCRACSGSVRPAGVGVTTPECMCTCVGGLSVTREQWPSRSQGLERGRSSDGPRWPWGTLFSLPQDARNGGGRKGGGRSPSGAGLPRGTERHGSRNRGGRPAEGAPRRATAAAGDGAGGAGSAARAPGHALGDVVCDVRVPGCPEPACPGTHPGPTLRTTCSAVLAGACTGEGAVGCSEPCVPGAPEPVPGGPGPGFGVTVNAPLPKAVPAALPPSERL